jgi:very-short-patch-repair endonuclease
MRRFAREQRANAVQAEALIWAAVRNRRCEGAKFQRQVVLGDTIADFVCFERRLVVEIDGPSHDSEEQKIAKVAHDAMAKPSQRLFSHNIENQQRCHQFCGD